MKLQSVTRSLLIVGGLLASSSVVGQGAWQANGLFRAFSRTAQAITGDIRLTRHEPARVGCAPVTLALANGRRVRLSSVGTLAQGRDGGADARQRAEVLRFAQDPGPLLHGNMLCGDPATHPARYAALYRPARGSVNPALCMAVFSSKEPPPSLDSADLCAIYCYEH